MDKKTIEENIGKLTLKINQIAKTAQRNPFDIQIVAVSKFQPVEYIEAAYHCGLKDFAENYIQEWQKKSAQLSHLKDIRWHIIGHVQSNKAQFLNENVFCLQSLDSLSLAKNIEKKWHSEKPLKVLIQLKVDPSDTNKSGVPVQESAKLCEFISQSKMFEWRGFMGIGPAETDKQKLKALYLEFTSQCSILWTDFSNKKNEKKIISLGMSQDLDVALECGSNMVRVGTALFGGRRVLE
jgi:pyridoxal phosphate enzyme (YggS family)